MIKILVVILTGIFFYSKCNKRDEVDIRKVENVIKSSFEDFGMSLYINKEWEENETIVVMEFGDITKENLGSIKIENRMLEFMPKQEILDNKIEKFFEIVSWTSTESKLDFVLFYACKGATFNYSITYLDDKQRTAFKMDQKRERATCVD